MEQKINALKRSSKVIAVIMKIGYIAAIVALCLCAATLISTAITGKAAFSTSNGTNFILADGENASPAGLIAMSIVYFVMSGFLFAIFLLAQRMFGEISATGDPFTAKYVKTIRVIGILVAAMTFAIGLADWITSTITATKGTEIYTEAPGLVVGAIIFCLSYIIDYGCGLKKQTENPQK